MSTELQRLERLAERLRSLEPALPSPQARIRGLNLALAAVKAPQGARRQRSAGRFLLALAAAGAVLIVGTVAAAMISPSRRWPGLPLRSRMPARTSTPSV